VNNVKCKDQEGSDAAYFVAHPRISLERLRINTSNSKITDSFGRNLKPEYSEYEVVLLSITFATFGKRSIYRVFHELWT